MVLRAWHRSVFAGIGLVLWGGLLAFGAVLAHMSMVSAGESGVSPTVWPDDSGLLREDGRTSVLVFVHPRCPCTSSTLHNLASVLRGRGDGPGGADVTIVRSGPGVRAEDRAADSVAVGPLRVRAVLDTDGAEARRFGVRTSGHVIVVDVLGRVVFSGGVTPGRGHVGACDALARFERAVLAGGGEEAPEVVLGALMLPVYGCPIFDEAACADETAPCCTPPLAGDPLSYERVISQGR